MNGKEKEETLQSRGGTGRMCSGGEEQKVMGERVHVHTRRHLSVHSEAR